MGEFFTNIYKNLTSIQLTWPGRICIILAVIAAIAGFYVLLTGFVPLVPKRYQKTVKSFKERGTSHSHVAGNIEASLQRVSKKLAKHIHINDIERSEMSKALRLSDITESPEEYKAYMYISAAIFFIMAILVFVIGALLPLEGIFKTGTRVVAVALVIAGLAMYWLNKRKINARKEQAIIEIERELPRFVSYLNHALQSEESSVLGILDRYIANEDRFGAELRMAIVDAKSSNFQRAMTAWEMRCASDQLKQVTHGLIAANNGDDVIYYFEMLERDFTNFEIAALRKNVKTVPQQLRLPKLLLLISVFAALFFPIIASIAESVKLFFT